MVRSSVVVLVLSTAALGCGDHASGSNDVDAGADTAEQGSDAPPAIDAPTPDAAPTPDTPHLVASNVYQCAINATDLICFTSTDILNGGSIWTAPKAGGAQTTIVQHTARPIRIAANATGFVTLSGHLDVTHLDIDGTNPTLLAPSASMDVYNSPIAMVGNDVYFVSGAGGGPKVYDFDVTNTHNLWSDLDSTDPTGNLASDGTAIFYSKSHQIHSPGLPTVTTDLQGLDEILSLSADHDAFYITARATIGIGSNQFNVIYRVSRTDGSTTALASAPLQTYKWAEVVAGADSVYWTSRDAALSAVSKQGGAVTVIDAGTLPELQIFADDTYVWWINDNNELYRLAQ
ncbi:MAG TPA: hypothetical protein VGM90_13860 [Kofleriaceae bacterium]|jgi:hypothetical protein